MNIEEDPNISSTPQEFSELLELPFFPPFLARLLAKLLINS
jgi:hypothetical protein